MNVPTNYHTTVLLHEAVAGLAIVPNGVYVDATFGGGGHSRLILEHLGSSGRLIAFDQDQDAWQNRPDDHRLVTVTENFRFLKQFLRYHGCPEVDGILADLGVSSYQFDTAERGFSTRFDGPMDMRMDQRQELTAADVLMSYSEQQLHKLFEQYGEVRNARQLARHIVAGRHAGNLQRMEAFRALIAPVIKGQPHRYLAQVYQALRIEVNDEFGALRDFLEQAVTCLKPGGRIAIITFHSLEDRIVKHFFKRGIETEDMTPDPFGRTKHAWELELINNKPIEPTTEEIARNARARSARLRVAMKKVTD